MSDYVLMADSSCDIPADVLRNWDVEVCQLSFTFKGDPHTYLNYDMEPEVFYERMRFGEIANTSAINVNVFYDAFRVHCKAGKDVLYLAFSSALSGTWRFAEIAANELAQEFPNRRIHVTDTLAASAGFGLLVYLTSELKKTGATMDEAAGFAESRKIHVCHWFTVNDLSYLKRGGRVSPTAAIIGQLLQVKPVLHVDDGGFLVPVSKVRGRKASVAALAEQFFLTCSDYSKPVFIAHGDCIQDAERLADIISSKSESPIDIRIFNVGPVIGAHSGPGTLALFFIADKR